MLSGCKPNLQLSHLKPTKAGYTHGILLQTVLHAPGKNSSVIARVGLALG